MRDPTHSRRQPSTRWAVPVLASSSWTHPAHCGNIRKARIEARIVYDDAVKFVAPRFSIRLKKEITPGQLLDAFTWRPFLLIINYITSLEYYYLLNKRVAPMSRIRGGNGQRSNRTASLNPATNMERFLTRSS